MTTEQITRDINARGVYVDQAHCRRWIHRSNIARATMVQEMSRITGLSNPNSIEPLREWLNARSADMGNLQADSVREALSRTEGKVHRVLELRQFVSRTPITKYQAALNRVGDDGRMRDNLMYCGAVKTGRWSSTGINMQNLPRPIHADMLKPEGTPEREIQDAINAIRGMVSAAPGSQLVVSDLANIEARVLAWLAGEQWVVDAFARGEDIYKLTYSGMTGKPVAAVSKSERFIGKVACIAEGQRVLTDKGLVPIEQIRRCHRVWDGIEWVSHEGVVYKGEREVITYDGVTATPDHEVFTRDGRKVSIGDCARKQIPLAKTGSGRSPLRMGDGNVTEHRAEEPSANAACGMQRVRHQETDQYGQSAQRENERLPSVQPASANSPEAGQGAYGSEATLHEPEKCELQELRGPRGAVPVPVGNRRGTVGVGEPGRPTGDPGPDRQQRTLRAGQSALGEQQTARAEQAQHEDIGNGRYMGKDAQSVPLHDNAPVSACRVHAGADNQAGANGSSGEAEGLADYRVSTGKVRVYDIVNAGPRHRFTVEGKLAGNCLALGYQGGLGAFTQMAAGYDLDLSKLYDVVWDAAPQHQESARWMLCYHRNNKTDHDLDDNIILACEVVKLGWRAANPTIVDFWAGLEFAWRKAMQNPGKPQGAGRVALTYGKTAFGPAIILTLPSGRRVYHHSPSASEDGLRYWTQNSITKRWEKTTTYGGSLSETCAQAIARDVLAANLPLADMLGYKPVLLVHDEVITEQKGGSAEELSEVLSVVPKWAQGLPLDAEGYEAERYRK